MRHYGGAYHETLNFACSTPNEKKNDYLQAQHALPIKTKENIARFNAMLNIIKQQHALCSRKKQQKAKHSRKKFEKVKCKCAPNARRAFVSVLID